MRVFVAIDIDDDIRKSLADLQNEITAKTGIKKSDVKWVNPELTHLTLKFLGEVEDSRVSELYNAVKNVAGRHSAFDLDMRQVGYFGRKSARVLWIGTGQGADSLRQLQAELEGQLAQAGWPRENREFSGHLTLCRIKNYKAGLKLAAICEDYKDFKAGLLAVDSICVYQSQLAPTGPIYTLLANYKLQ